MQYKRRNKIVSKRILRIRLKISGTEAKPRLAVSRSNKNIVAQLIDDTKGVTLAASSTLKPEIASAAKGKKKAQQAFAVGEDLAKAAVAKGIKKVVFDRHGLPYIGRVKALAEGARKGGLEF